MKFLLEKDPAMIHTCKMELKASVALNTKILVSENTMERFVIFFRDYSKINLVQKK